MAAREVPRPLLRREPAPEGGLLRRGGARPHGLATAKIHGKELSFNNLLDLDGALRLLFDSARGCVILKHNNPCGAAVRRGLERAYELALARPVSAFGG